MANINLINAFQELKMAENFDRPTLMKIVEDVFMTILKKKYGSEEYFDIIVNVEKGDLEINRKRIIVPDNEVTDPNGQISLSEARKIEPDFEIGEEVYEDMDINDFGRRTAIAAKQVLVTRIQDLKKSFVTKKYTSRIGEIVSAEVYQVWQKEILLLDEEANELILPKNEQIPSDFFKKGDIVRAVVKKVETKGSNTFIIVSRTQPAFLAKLMEQEVPEIFDGLISIRKVVREPGERAKVLVESFDDRIDPVGACVGIKGSRIHGIVRELKNENIDIISYTNNMQLLIQRTLTPAKPKKIEIDYEKKHAVVYVDAEEVSQAIGKRGINIRLACKLIDFEIDVYREQQEFEKDEFDVKIEEFEDEIESWIIQELRNIGCDTGRSILNLSVEELARRSDLEIETVKEVQKIIKQEFEKE